MRTVRHAIACAARTRQGCRACCTARTAEAASSATCDALAQQMLIKHATTKAETGFALCRGCCCVCECVSVGATCNICPACCCLLVYFCCYCWLVLTRGLVAACLLLPASCLLLLLGDLRWQMKRLCDSEMHFKSTQVGIPLLLLLLLSHSQRYSTILYVGVCQTDR